jgi:drug/metabolite transporter (DMT)-like permease
MKNFLSYIITVLIWGSTWLAIEFQLGEVAVEVAVFYRFAIAALIMWAYCLLTRHLDDLQCSQPLIYPTSGFW